MGRITQFLTRRPRLGPRAWMGIAAALVVVAVGYLLVAFLIARGTTAAEREPHEGDPGDFGLTFEEVRFKPRGDDLALEGWYVPGAPGEPVVLFVHGQGSQRTGDDILPLAADFAARGYGALMFDLRAHGTSGGDRASGGFFEQRDVLGALDYLQGRGVPPERVGVLGFSMGAAAAVLAAEQEPALQALALDSPYAKVGDLVTNEAALKTPFPRWLIPAFIPPARLMAKWFYGIDLGRMIPEESVATLDYPILVIHGKNDDRVPVEHGIRVHGAAAAGSELWLVDSPGHSDAYLEAPEEYVRRIAAYFEGRPLIEGCPLRKRCAG